jgi:hypothetical protein
MAEENTTITLGRYTKTQKERCLDGQYRHYWMLESWDLAATVKEKPYEVLKELFPFYQIAVYRGIVVRTPQYGIFTRQKNDALIINSIPSNGISITDLKGIYRSRIAPARRNPNRRSREILESEAKEILRVLSEKNPLRDMIKKDQLERLTAVEEAKYALADYL